MDIRRFKKFIKPLINTPLHPQWHTARGGTLIELLSAIKSTDKTLDIGCYDKWTKKHINAKSSYIGLDYLETASKWYFSKPDIYGDAHSLPLGDSTIDNVLLLDVLEHVSHIDTVLEESFRVLKIEGKAVIKIPFLYPLHDEPRDFVRLTKYGIKQKATNTGFTVSTIYSSGHPLETAALLKNIAVSKVFIHWLGRKNPLFLLSPLLPLYFLLQNLSSFILAKTTPDDDLMPYSYLIILTKNKCL